MAELLLSFPELRLLGIRFSRMHLRRLELAGRFPQGIWLGPNRKAWRASEIERWIAERPTSRPPLLNPPVGTESADREASAHRDEPSGPPHRNLCRPT